MSYSYQVTSTSKLLGPLVQLSDTMLCLFHTRPIEPRMHSNDVHSSARLCPYVTHATRLRRAVVERDWPVQISCQHRTRLVLRDPLSITLLFRVRASSIAAAIW